MCPIHVGIGRVVGWVIVGHGRRWWWWIGHHQGRRLGHTNRWRGVKAVEGEKEKHIRMSRRSFTRQTPNKPMPVISNEKYVLGWRPRRGEIRRLALDDASLDILGQVGLAADKEKMVVGSVIEAFGNPLESVQVKLTLEAGQFGLLEEARQDTSDEASRLWRVSINK
jgi:hypothetical protein